MNDEGARQSAPDLEPINRSEDTAPPTVTLIFPLEGRLRVTDTCRDQAEIDRMKFWLRSRPELAELVGKASRLVEREAA